MTYLTYLYFFMLALAGSENELVWEYILQVEGYTID
jgi:hypothetical protein